MRDFFVNLVGKTIKERETNKIVRKDLIQYLIQLRDNGIIETNDDDDDWNMKSGKFCINLNACFD